jgi:hypothetical protein|tara:strand:- start:80 stop:481 length:402 start_codon:yes stop_codon:yes gene_type:complete
MSAIKPDLSKLVSVYLKIRDRKAEVASELNAQIAELDTKLKTISSALLEHCKDNSVESVRTEDGTFYRSTRTRYWTGDWEAMNSFILKHEAVDLMEKRLHQGNMRTFLEENPALLPPGLNVDSEYTVTVRRKK